MKKTGKGRASASEREGRPSLSVLPLEPDHGFSREFVAALISGHPEAFVITDKNFRVLFHSKIVKRSPNYFRNQKINLSAGLSSGLYSGFRPETCRFSGKNLIISKGMNYQ